MIAEMDSLFASSTKAQVLTITTSALDGSLITRSPLRCRSPSITSASTVFFGQPSATSATECACGVTERRPKFGVGDFAVTAIAAVD